MSIRTITYRGFGTVESFGVGDYIVFYDLSFLPFTPNVGELLNISYEHTLTEGPPATYDTPVALGQAVVLRVDELRPHQYIEEYIRQPGGPVLDRPYYHPLYGDAYYEPEMANGLMEVVYADAGIEDFDTKSAQLWGQIAQNFNRIILVICAENP